MSWLGAGVGKTKRDYSVYPLDIAWLASEAISPLAEKRLTLFSGVRVGYLKSLKTAKRMMERHSRKKKLYFRYPFSMLYVLFGGKVGYISWGGSRCWGCDERGFAL